MSLKFFKKRRVFVLLSICLCLISILVVGCGSSEPVDIEEPASIEEPLSLDLSIAVGNTGGVWHAMGEAVGEVIRKDIPNSKTTIIPGGDAGNVTRTQTKEVDLAFAYGSTVVGAINGFNPFDNNPQPGVRVVAPLFSSVSHFAILENLNLNSFDGLAKVPLKVSVNQIGSSMEVTSRAVLEGYGITYKDIESWGGKVHFLASGPANDLMRDGHLNAIFDAGPLPRSQTIELQSDFDFVFLPISDEIRKQVNQKYGTVSTILPANTYLNQPEDLPTIKTPGVLITHIDTPNEEVYAIVKAIEENRNHLADVHKDLAEVQKEFLSVLNLHPGAEMYYKEMGYLK